MICPKCGWENQPKAKTCLQCGIALESAMSAEFDPPRKGKKDKFTTAKLFKREKPVGAVPSSLDLNPFLRFFYRIWNFLWSSLPTYLKIVLTAIVGFIPGLGQLIGNRIKLGLLFLTTAAFLIVMFTVLITSEFSTFILYLIIFLAVISSYDNLVRYFKANKYSLNIPIHIGLLLTSMSWLFFVCTLFYLIFNIFYFWVALPDNRITSLFQINDHILFNRRAYQNRPIERGDIVAAVHYEGLPGLERIIGLPGDEIKIINGAIYVNDEPLDENRYPLAQVPAMDATIKLTDNAYFLFGYRQHNQNDPELISYTKNQIVGKALLIFNPPPSRRILP